MDNIGDALSNTYPNGLNGKEIIRRITEIYHEDYDLDNKDFDIYDQLLACEAIDESEREYKEDGNSKGNANVNWNDNGGCKLETKSDVNWYKSETVSQLTLCTTNTPQIEIASLLEKILKSWPSKEGHWLWTAQTYTPRVLNWVMSATVREYLRGGIRTNPARFFTFQLRYRTKRKQFRNNIEIR